MANVKTLFLVYFGMIFGILLLLYVPKLKEFKDSSSSDVVKNAVSTLNKFKHLTKMKMKMTLKHAIPLIWTLKHKEDQQDRERIDLHAY